MGGIQDDAGLTSLKDAINEMKQIHMQHGSDNRSDLIFELLSNIILNGICFNTHSLMPESTGENFIDVIID